MAWQLGDYCSLDDIRTEVNIKAANTTPDGRIEQYIAEASRKIDDYCQRHFYGVVETRYFDAEEDTYDRDLLLDEDLAGVISITLGDGTILATTDYVTRPANFAPKNTIRMLRSSVHAWQNFVTNSENAIAVNGTWGFNAGTLPPEPVRRAAIELVRWMFHRQRAAPESNAGGDKGGYTVSSDLPKEIQDGLITYVRPRFGATS